MNPQAPARLRLVWPRLLLGLVVLISAEVFSGASLKSGLWHPWTLLVTFWLYFAHFFLFTTLAVWTGRTSLGSLYLWGVLYGLYESWITKVIWSGYEGNGKFVLGSVGPFGFSEFSMVVLFHPLMSFILPLAVACAWFPSLRPRFAASAWFLESGRWPRIIRIYLVLQLGAVVAMNCGGPINLVLNVMSASAAFAGLWRLSRPSRTVADATSIVVFGRLGFGLTVAYLAFLYIVGYFKLRPEGLPSAQVQWLTAGFYAIALLGLWLQPRRGLGEFAVQTGDPAAESRRIVWVVAGILGLGLVLACLPTKVLFLPLIAGFALWTPLGFVLLAVVLVNGLRERRRV